MTVATLHLKILAKANPRLLGDAKVIKSFLFDLVNRVDMTPLADPTIHNVALDVAKLGREPFEDEGGVTGQVVGFVTLSTSHAAIHTWPLREEFHLDLFSCREFNGSQVVKWVEDVLGCGRMRVHDLTDCCKWN